MRAARVARLALTLAALLAAPAFAQFGDVPKPGDLVHVHAAAVRAPAGGVANVMIGIDVLKQWHVNANPASPSSIPTEVHLEPSPGATPGAPLYPPPHVVKLPIDDQPLSVWDGAVEIRVPVEIAPGAAPGPRTLKGTLRFQACNDQICLPPAKLAFDAPLEIVAAGAAGTALAPADTTRASVPAPAPIAPAPSAFTTQPPANGGRAALHTPLSDTLERGGWAAFLTLFVIGLALNLTPCVYPMLSVTVSVFGARRAAPPIQVAGSALLYVLGMATMYSTLGLIAAFTGGLFGGWLANPLVSVGIGVLLIALSLSMFGLYQLNAPPALLARLGGAGATSAVGIFLSGLLVGVFAAPCVGPPVVALLAVVGQKGDPLFGFASFFTLAMGLGAPYLVLGTFSNLIQRLPRSGEWMIWVEHVFGAILFGVGANYVLLALAPRVAAWVLPVALAAGGLWFGWIEKSGSPRPAFRAFKRVAGTLAVAAAVAFVATTPRHGLAFATLAGDDVAARAARQPYLIDFSADWCQPCHELERTTFADRAVIESLREFKLFQVNLTRYDSPEADRWRKQFQIRGVPTVIFVRADGVEVREARVEGFVPPAEFLRRVAAARQALAAR